MPSATTTIFNQNANAIAQFHGGPGRVDYAPTYAATMALDLANNAYAFINGLNSTSPTSTITATTGGVLGQEAAVMIKDTGGITVTLSTNFKVSATVNPTTGKTITVFFMSNGTNWIETGRSTAITH
jgi:hypothetical protein